MLSSSGSSPQSYTKLNENKYHKLNEFIVKLKSKLDPRKESMTFIDNNGQSLTMYCGVCVYFIVDSNNRNEDSAEDLIKMLKEIQNYNEFLNWASKAKSLSKTHTKKLNWELTEINLSNKDILNLACGFAFTQSSNETINHS